MTCFNKGDYVKTSIKFSFKDMPYSMYSLKMK